MCPKHPKQPSAISLLKPAAVTEMETNQADISIPYVIVILKLTEKHPLTSNIKYH